MHHHHRDHRDHSRHSSSGERCNRGEFRGDSREHGRHGRFGRGGRSSRVFDHGELRLVVLSLIAEQPRHGYEIIKAIEERVGGAYAPSPGVIYPTLGQLQEIGLASVTEAEGRKLYAITAEGSAYLDANRAAVDTALARMKEVGEAHGGGPAPQILRATENLKLALRMRLGQGPLSEDKVHAITDILDAAAKAVERS